MAPSPTSSLFAAYTAGTSLPPAPTPGPIPWAPRATSESALERNYVFPTSCAAAAFITLAAEIGESTGYVPGLDLRGKEVTLRVATDAEAGFNELGFDVARLFEQRL